VREKRSSQGKKKNQFWPAPRGTEKKKKKKKKKKRGLPRKGPQPHLQSSGKGKKFPLQHQKGGERELLFALGGGKGRGVFSTKTTFSNEKARPEVEAYGKGEKGPTDFRIFKEGIAICARGTNLLFTLLSRKKNQTLTEASPVNVPTAKKGGKGEKLLA